MAVLAGARDSFARAEVLLRELAGWELDDEVIRQLTHATGGSIAGTAAGPTPALCGSGRRNVRLLRCGRAAGRAILHALRRSSRVSGGSEGAACAEANSRANR